jgi:hypothetical protein
MTKPKSAATPYETLMNGTRLADAGARTEAFWEAQATAVEHVREYLDQWWERRQSAASAAAECCAKLAAGAADPAAGAEAWSAWASGALERLSQDAAGQAALAGRLAGDAMSVLSAEPKGSPKRRAQHAAHAQGNGAAKARHSSEADVR